MINTRYIFNPKLIKSQTMKILLREIRKELGLTQEAFAEKAGISLRYLQNIEHGDSIPRLQKIEKMAKALKISIHKLIDD